jgi:hypothetical protein
MLGSFVVSSAHVTVGVWAAASAGEPLRGFGKVGAGLCFMQPCSVRPCSVRPCTLQPCSADATSTAVHSMRRAREQGSARRCRGRDARRRRAVARLRVESASAGTVPPDAVPPDAVPPDAVPPDDVPSEALRSSTFAFVVFCGERGGYPRLTPRKRGRHASPLSFLVRGLFRLGALAGISSGHPFSSSHSLFSSSHSWQPIAA